MDGIIQECYTIKHCSIWVHIFRIHSYLLEEGEYSVHTGTTYRTISLSLFLLKVLERILRLEHPSMRPILKFLGVIFTPNETLDITREIKDSEHSTPTRTDEQYNFFTLTSNWTGTTLLDDNFLYMQR